MNPPLPHYEWILTEEGWCMERIERWIALLESAIHAESAPLETAWMPAPERNSPSVNGGFQPLHPGQVWGEHGATAHFRFSGTIPAKWAGKPVVALINLEGEAGILDSQGAIVQRLSSGNAFGIPCEMEEIPLQAACKGGEPVLIEVGAWASSIVGLDRPLDPSPIDPDRNGTHRARLLKAELRVLRPETRALFHDVEILFGLAKQSPAHGVRRARILTALMDALVAWQDNPAHSAAAREIVREELERPATASSVEAIAIGHAHIDTAWLWRVRDSVGKCLRTFASQADLIERYPGYRFGATSAQHYAFIKEQHPRLYQKIRHLVADGRWEIQGGMWVEPDTNIPSGESLIRQILYGQQFFREELGQECDNAWLPDVFGLSAALPQILLQSGLSRLLTKKPHWSRSGHFPHTAFRWVGHDGSEVLVHLLPQARDYNGLMRAEDLVSAERGFHEKGRFEKFIYTFGIGDGGGGPMPEMIERALRMRSIEGLPRVRFGTSREVFEQFEAGREHLTTLTGDLYLEAHRGTFTTQARLKADNRRLEALLALTEHLFCYLPPEQYPHTELRDCWRTVLLHQFHDILPGSGIHEVVADAREGNARVFSELEALRQRFAKTLPEVPGTLSLFNPLANAWSGVLDGDSALANATGPLPAQSEPEGRVVSLVTLEPLGFTALKTGGSAPEAKPLSQPVLENEFLRCEFHEDGSVRSVYDKIAGRETLAAGSRGNLLSLYVDRPIEFDAWDIDHFYTSECVETAHAVAPWTGWSGPVRSVLVFRLEIGTSEIIQRCILCAGSRRIDFETEVHWRERHRMLRVGFTANLWNPEARCEIQHGYLKRSTTRNTPRENARFEVPCHRYACLLDERHGAALLNDSKYGIRLEGNLMELALLRSPTYPDHSADLGVHHFTYSFLPLASVQDFALVPVEAAILNTQPARFENRNAAGLAPLFKLEGTGLGVEAVKRAEESDALVVRVVEQLGIGSKVNITQEGSLVTPASPMEIAVDGSEPNAGPFQFRTFLLQPVGVGSGSMGPASQRPATSAV